MNREANSAATVPPEAVTTVDEDEEKEKLIEKYSSNEFTQALLKHMHEAKKIALQQ